MCKCIVDSDVGKGNFFGHAEDFACLWRCAHVIPGALGMDFKALILLSCFYCFLHLSTPLVCMLPMHVAGNMSIFFLAAC